MDPKKLREFQRMRVLQRDQAPSFLSKADPVNICAPGDGHPLVGEKLLKEGKIATLVLAGGQATRLGCTGPKGCATVAPVTKKTLFDIILDKKQAAEKLAGRPLHMALMASEQNFEATKEALKGSDIHLFKQGALPLVDLEGEWFEDAPGNIAMGPDGNGKAFAYLKEAGILDKWAEDGVQYINVIPIDNPLADPYDLALVGQQHEEKSELIVKAIKKVRPTESVGMLGTVNNRLHIVEYSEADVPWHIAFAGLFSISLNLARLDVELPWHLAQKKWHKHGVGEIPIWKFEYFIFDLFPHTRHFTVSFCDRDQCFSPLKRKEGKESFETVKADLLALHRHKIEHITGKKAPDHPFEIAWDFFYPTPTLLEKWQGCTVPKKDYIEP